MYLGLCDVSRVVFHVRRRFLYAEREALAEPLYCSCFCGDGGRVVVCKVLCEKSFLTLEVINDSLDFVHEAGAEHIGGGIDVFLSCDFECSISYKFVKLFLFGFCKLQLFF